LNLGKVWQEVDAPVLVLHGTADTIMSPSDSRAISDIVNRAHPGHATYVDIQDADHLLAVHNKLEDVVPTMMDWLRKQLGRQ
jgi:alpha-beta hydrolase superfamily lysophospholipase